MARLGNPASIWQLEECKKLAKDTGAITGALSMLFSVKLMAPHGGLFVLAIPNAVSAVPLYLLAIAVGSLFIGVSYALVKVGRADVSTAPA